MDGADVHVFYLQAPRSLGDPELRHRNASIGHAVSRDLRSWTVLPDAVRPGDPGEFDSLATWTGSVVRWRRRWLMLYSGISTASTASTAEDGAVQRIGSAVSDDLVRWERRGVALEADARWYEAAGDVHWRDPWVWVSEDGRLRMLLTARARTGPLALRGVLGTATSPDGERWEAGPPASAPGELFQLEVPQLVPDGSRWHVLFSSTERDVGSHHLTGPSPYGPFTLAPGPFLLGGGDWYAARAIEHRGESRLLAWRLRDDSGGFGGWLSDPMPLALGRG